MSQVEPSLSNPANLLSLSRLVLAPVVWALMSLGLPIAAALVFLAAAVTDWLDGLVARRLKISSSVGRQLDPLTDKVLVIGCFVYAMGVVPDSGLAAWMVTAIVIREMVVQAIRGLIEGRGSAFGAKLSGKLKTVLQFAAIVAVLLVWSGRLPPGWTLVRDALIWAAVLLTIGSGLQYLLLAWTLLSRGGATPSPDRGSSAS